MTIHSYVEAFLKYAEEYLLLDTLDEEYVREKAYACLGLARDEAAVDVDVQDLETMTSPSLILGKIMEYVEENLPEKNIETVKAAFCDCFIKRPSEIQDIFSSLAAKNADKAISWLYDYNLKDGYIADYIRRWEAKATKGKIEVAYLPQINKHDECALCRDIEGRGVYRNLRLAPMELCGEEWICIPSKYPKFLGQSNLAMSKHAPMGSDEKALKVMADFIDAAPSHFAAYRNCSGQKKHGHIIIGEKALPLFKANVLTLLKSAEYPYITLELVEWYSPVIRMTCTTKDKIIEFALKVAKDWQHPCGYAIRKNGNYYIIDLLLGSDKTVENCPLIEDKICLPAEMGAFSLTKNIYDDSIKIEKLLTKELNINTAGNLDKYHAMIERLVKAVGTAKLSPVEAALDVKDEINRTLENALKDRSIYPVGSEELLSLIEERTGIKKHI